MRPVVWHHSSRRNVHVLNLRPDVDKPVGNEDDRGHGQNHSRHEQHHAQNAKPDEGRDQTLPPLGDAARHENDQLHGGVEKNGQDEDDHTRFEGLVTIRNGQKYLVKIHNLPYFKLGSSQGLHFKGVTIPVHSCDLL